MVDVYVALLGLLDDSEPFVVAKAVEGLSGADLAVAVEPLAKAAVKYPDLAPTILEMLARGSTMRSKALPHLHKFTTHEEPRIRAAAIAALCSISFDDMEEKVLSALGDEDSTVRIAAVSAALEAFEARYRKAREKRSEAARQVSRVIYHSPSATIDRNLFSIAAKLLGGAIKPATPPAPEPAEEAKPAADAEGADAKGVKKKDDKDKTPAEAKPEQEDYWWDQWLRQCYAGRNRPNWTARMTPLLEKMLAAESPKERIAAAVLLAPLGKPNEAAPILQKTVRENPELMEPAAKVLTWLVWEERLKAFRSLQALVSNETAFRELIGGLRTVTDPRAADLYWQLLADPKIDDQTAQDFLYPMMLSYSDTNYVSSSISPAVRRRIVEGAKPHALSGGDWQRRTALALLAYADKEAAAETAMKLAHDPKLSDTVRNEALRVQLVTQAATEAHKAALAELSSTTPPRKKIALAFLAHGAKAFSSMPGSFYWSLGTHYSSSSGNQPIVPKPPQGLKIDDVRPLLGDADPETAAYAGYLAVLLGDRQGISPLLKYWRNKQQDSDPWTESVYRAIAVIDDPMYIPVLREIFAKLDSYKMRDFYWTIRIMSGGEILEFRKQVRDAMKKANAF